MSSGRLRAMVLALSVPLCACAAGELERASASYRALRDYASLEAINRHLTVGMARAEVLRLLGEPDYSPVEGQDYYSSDRMETRVDTLGAEVPVTVGIIADYRTRDGKLTDELQAFELGPIAE